MSHSFLASEQILGKFHSLDRCRFRCGSQSRAPDHLGNMPLKLPPGRDGLVAERGSVTRSSFAKASMHEKIKAG